MNIAENHRQPCGLQTSQRHQSNCSRDPRYLRGTKSKPLNRLRCAVVWICAWCRSRSCRRIHSQRSEIQARGLVLLEYALSAFLRPLLKMTVMDPVMGDNGRLYVNEDVVPAYKSLLPCADLILPNQFEAEYEHHAADRTVTVRYIAHPANRAIESSPPFLSLPSQPLRPQSPPSTKLTISPTSSSPPSASRLHGRKLHSYETWTEIQTSMRLTMVNHVNR